MKISDLSTLNAFLNTLSTLFLLWGYVRIRNADRKNHKKLMLTALFTSALFLLSYLIYHYYVGSVAYPYHNWTRPVYFAILIPHVLLAALMTPFILATVWLALTERFEKHRRLARWVFPVWIFVSISGVVVYLMLYR